MGRVVSVRLANDQRLLVEIDEVATGFEEASLGIGASPPVFLESISALTAAASELFHALSSVHVKPSACEITFGVKLSGAATAILARASAEGNFAVKMSWTGLNGDH
jgi:hypothetical protein